VKRFISYLLIAILFMALGIVVGQKIGDKPALNIPITDNRTSIVLENKGLAVYYDITTDSAGVSTTLSSREYYIISGDSIAKFIPNPEMELDNGRP